MQILFQIKSLINQKKIFKKCLKMSVIWLIQKVVIFLSLHQQQFIYLILFQWLKVFEVLFSDYLIVISKILNSQDCFKQNPENVFLIKNEIFLFRNLQSLLSNEIQGFILCIIEISQLLHQTALMLQKGSYSSLLLLFHYFQQHLLKQQIYQDENIYLMNLKFNLGLLKIYVIIL
ncbi:unnamed protein product [Paramecium sonneborni]|uniref:Uncharacterized protein n=1 Tax=Paramecium sonneborni TaxID=65129 RepID=A0A8S1QEI3_9CILI|nr:unnamed protein product [Paramecium sonneborni]